QGVTKVLPAAAGATKLFGRVVPAVGGALGVTEGLIAVTDVAHQVSTGQYDRNKLAKDFLEIGAGGLGDAVIVAVVAAAAPEDVAVLALGGALLSAAAVAVPASSP